MPNGDVSPPTDDEISDIIHSLRRPGEGAARSSELARRALSGGMIEELVIQVFGADAVREAK